MLLGIFERCTPGLTSAIGLLTATLGSFQETHHILSELGQRLDVKTIRLIAYRSADRVRLVQQQGQFGFGADDSLAGRRVVVSTDGGRVRLREKKRGPKTHKGRNRYHGAWREPKLFIIYVVDAQGQQLQSFAPLIDGVMRGPDTLFALLQHYLAQLQIQDADHLLFVSDGAPWIWNRVPTLLDKLRLDRRRVHLLIDFYHAVQHLHRVAALRKDWSARKRKQWANKQRQLLRCGQVAQVIDAIRPLCRGRHSKALKTELAYFVKHQRHMAYDTMTQLHLPIGSGAIESAIRRIVNLRLKGPSIFWHKPNAESLLLLRAAYKSGRWQLFRSLTFSPFSVLD